MAVRRSLRRQDYTVGWVCALPVELAAAQEMLDEVHDNSVCEITDTVIYTLGCVCGHNVVVACLPEAETGTSSAAAIAVQMKAAFPCIHVGLMVGVGGGVPSPESDIRLGDIVVGRPENQHGGVVQYDFGKSTPSGFQRTGYLNAPPEILQQAVANVRARHLRGERRLTEYLTKFEHLASFTRGYADADLLFEADYNHPSGSNCEECDKGRIVQRPPRHDQSPVIHYGTIASGNQVMRDAAERDRVSSELGGVLCFEMEAAGLMNRFPCLVIRGICDYSDSHKNKQWQPYAAGVAAAYATELLSVIPVAEMNQQAGDMETTGKPAGRQAFFTVPFQRDDKFVGRESIMTQIDEKFHSATWQKHVRVAFVGIGGIGARLRDPDLSVFWVYAANTTRYEQTYRDLADTLDIPGRNDPAADVLRLVFRWLSDDTNGRWLMIVDNADDDGMFFEATNKADETANSGGRSEGSHREPLIMSIPQTTNGSVIVTSRNANAARNLIGEQDNIIKVNAMDECEALALLQRKITLNEDEIQDGKKILEALDYIPLAITHAGSYIQTRFPRITVSKYLNLLQENEASLIGLLENVDDKDLRRDHGSERAVTATLQISFEQIRATNPAASDLLSLMAMFDRQGIPERLLNRGRNPLQFEEALFPLISFSLVKQQDGQASFEMHRLVQVSLRRWLEDRNELETWIGRSVAILGKRLPHLGPEAWWNRGTALGLENFVERFRLCRILIPHAQEVLHHCPEIHAEVVLGLRQRLKRKFYLLRKKGATVNTDLFLNWGILAYKVGHYFYYSGRFDESVEMERFASRYLQAAAGSRDIGTHDGLYGYALDLGKQGKHWQGFTMSHRAFEDMMATFHRMMEEAMVGKAGLRGHFLGMEGILADSLQGTGEPAEAEERLRETVVLLQNIEGRNDAIIHQFTLRLCRSLQSQGKYQEAEQMLRAAIDALQKLWGAENPATLVAISELGIVLRCSGRYEEANVMLNRALKGCENLFGVGHPLAERAYRELDLVLAERETDTKGESRGNAGTEIVAENTPPRIAHDPNRLQGP